jgi:hypothetical protein
MLSNVKKGVEGVEKILHKWSNRLNWVDPVS